MARWVRDNRRGAKRDIEAAMAHGLNMAAEALLGDANQTVPHEEGILEASGGTADASAGDLNASVYYNTPYALVQHEDPTLNHPGKGRAAWLEKTLAERQEVYRKIVLDAISGVLGGGSSGGGSGGGSEMVEYTTRSGKTRMATQRQVDHWTRNQ